MTPQPDFLRPVRGPHPAAWLACGLAAALLADAAADAWALRAAWAPTAATAVASEAPEAAPRTSVDADRAAARAVASLARPWGEALVALEAATPPGLRWLALDIGENGQARLEGVADDGLTPDRVAQALAARAPWRGAVVGRVDLAQAPVRFEIAARVEGAAP